MDSSSLHIGMFPWFAMGHLTPFLHLSNKLAKRGHKISFFIPRRTQSKLEQFNLFPDLITFFPIDVPHVEGLPHGAETTSDVPISLHPLLMTAMDRTERNIELLLLDLKPQIVFFDFTYWLPNITSRLGIKSLQYIVVNRATLSYTTVPPRMNHKGSLTELDLMQPPLGYPVSSIKLQAHEAKFLASMRNLEFGSGVLFHDRIYSGLTISDAIGFKGCREIEGPYVDYLAEQFGKSVVLSGPIIPEPPNTVLEEIWRSWLGSFKDDSVVFCSLGSEWKLPHGQFQELLLGLELTGLPFLAAVIWQLILEHSSVGCFITHCGTGSLTEGLVNKCQMVFLPQLNGDQIINARMMGRNLKVGVEVEKGEEDGLVTKERISKAVKIVMDEENEVGREVRENHAKWRNFLVSNDLESICVDNLCEKLQHLLE
ncbi:hypothetical protein VNO80_27239 [Phaseolus coccineus]|uniref:Uncharacterized protein n=1 Tax=Phaseolus coccineus TaxID=3886 RepID=A0AAN9LGF3_PHACN